MPADNVNTAALALVVDAAQRFQKLSEALDLSPLDDDDGTLSTAIFMMEKVLEKEVAFRRAEERFSLDSIFNKDNKDIGV